jgi:hypothetical protein
MSKGMGKGTAVTGCNQTEHNQTSTLNMPLFERDRSAKDLGLVPSVLVDDNSNATVAGIGNVSRYL